ncbi:sulfur carrier protein ThiS [Paenibacillus protaetiae]|uniref:Sulfur carrier protein ThiS n=1 Tax=Paenibacillus protaetiae TaxID=2509456 RepID=A0A4P6EXP6_9BACL|nr:sulfur carrier protein ThiS [Paenibacillus protaetiae]QAY66519.1 sulfur carrier protein ThiS [Paenibacillus protaetiae]
MKLMINGGTHELDVQTVLQVVEHFGLTERPVVVEAGGTVLKKEQWADTQVYEGMVIELVQFVGGG